MHVANSTKYNCIFTIRVPCAYVIPEGNVRLHLGLTDDNADDDDDDDDVCNWSVYVQSQRDGDRSASSE